MNDNAIALPEIIEEKKNGPLALCPIALREAKESYGIVLTMLLSTGGGNKSAKTFYAHFLMNMNLQWTNWLGGRPMETAGVSITDKLNLYINPTFWNKQTGKAKQELLEHEIEHIVFKHISRSKDYIDLGKNSAGRLKCANISMDAGINENKPNITADGFGVTYERLNKQLEEIKSRYRVGPDEPWETTYEKLMQAAKENPNKGEGGEGFGDPIDDHSTWAESTENKEVAEGLVRDASNKAQNATGIANMPQHMLKEIADMNKASVNWQREMRQFATSALRYDFTRTRNRRNRRDIYGEGLRLSGRKKKPQLKIAVCLDSSGSVGDDAFAQFFAEVAEIHKMGIEIVCIDADTGVAAVYDFDPKKPHKRYGNGGTSYQAAITKAVELKVDAIAYMGDMDSSDRPNNPGIPFMWVVVGNQNPPGDFGRIVRITERKK